MTDQDPPHPPPPLTPGRYLRLRREAGGLTISELALLIASDRRRPVRVADRTTRERDLTALEAGTAGPGVDIDLVRQIDRHVRFDEQVYLALVGLAAAPDAGLPVPPHCRTCGCSWNDACFAGGSSFGVPCAWADDAATRCTSCPEPAETLPAQSAPEGLARVAEAAAEGASR